MLSSVLNSEIAVEVNISIIRTFVAMRGVIFSPVDTNARLRREMKELKDYMEEIFTDPDGIDEDTRIQLELINRTLAELQMTYGCISIYEVIGKMR